MFKFRTMSPTLDENGKLLSDRLRITKLGLFLRSSSLDELPELWNVIKGEMSIIGPRPESPYYVQYYTQNQRQILQVLPGITGPSQFANRNEEEKLKGKPNPEQFYIDILMPEKLQIDLEYIKRRNCYSDMLWVVRTILGIILY